MWRRKDYRLPVSCTVAFGSCSHLWFNGRGRTLPAAGDRGEVKVDKQYVRRTTCLSEIYIDGENRLLIQVRLENGRISVLAGSSAGIWCSSSAFELPQSDNEKVFFGFARNIDQADQIFSYSDSRIINMRYHGVMLDCLFYDSWVRLIKKKDLLNKFQEPFKLPSWVWSGARQGAGRMEHHCCAEASFL